VSGASTGDGRINVPSTLGNAPAIGNESRVVMSHLAAADLISGVQIVPANNNFGEALPEAKIGGGFWIGFTNNGAAAGSVTGMRPGHYLVMNGTIANAGGTNGITTTQAAQIDRKIDDGVGDAGDVHATGTGCLTSGVYQEATVTANCSLYLRVQG
jgi:hypothetical protein